MKNRGRPFFASPEMAGKIATLWPVCGKERQVDDDDKFWKIPEGRSWKEAGPMLRTLEGKRDKPRRDVRPKASAKRPTNIDRASEFQRRADFYRGIGQNFEADFWDRQAAKARQPSPMQRNG
jgi:hypothetical protein